MHPDDARRALTELRARLVARLASVDAQLARLGGVLPPRSNADRPPVHTR